MTNKHNTVLYIGVTNNLVSRLIFHSKRDTRSFTSRYRLNKLVYYESTDDIWVAISREKQLKNWRRVWKNNLIASSNSDWKDLSIEIMDPEINSG